MKPVIKVPRFAMAETAFAMLLIVLRIVGRTAAAITPAATAVPNIVVPRAIAPPMVPRVPKVPIVPIMFPIVTTVPMVATASMTGLAISKTTNNQLVR